MKKKIIPNIQSFHIKCNIFLKSPMEIASLTVSVWVNMKVCFVFMKALEYILQQYLTAVKVIYFCFLRTSIAQSSLVCQQQMESHFLKI